MQLEKRVEELTQKLIATKLENESLQAKNQLPPPGYIPETSSDPPILPTEDFEGLGVVVRQRSLPPSAGQYLPLNHQFAQSFVVQAPVSTGV